MDPTRALDTAIDDLPTARALIASLQEQLTKSQREIAALRHELDILCQRLFGKKSERVDPRQLKLALEQLANERGPITEPVEMDSGETPVRGHSRRRPTGRRPLPAHLPRRRVEIDVAEADKPCACGHCGRASARTCPRSATTIPRAAGQSEGATPGAGASAV